jgi:drug/metabolite transporter (DMT)-like permease
LIALAAVLWSLSGGFSKVLTQETVFGLNYPRPAPFAIAFYRLLFAGLAFLPTLRLRDLSFRPLMPVMVGAFALMNLAFIPAMVLGKAADAILLQYTAPLWMVLASVLWLKEKADRRSLAAVALGTIGIAVILGTSIWQHGWASDELGVLSLGVAAGVTFAGVVICLRFLHRENSKWLTVLNHLGGAVIIGAVWLLLPLIWSIDATAPATLGQYVTLVLFGVVQMGFPYWLMTRGLRSVSPQEAGTITLLEPILNPVWAYLVAGEKPPPATFVGGVFILSALAWRYWPTGKPSETRPQGPGL